MTKPEDQAQTDNSSAEGRAEAAFGLGGLHDRQVSARKLTRRLWAALSMLLGLAAAVFLLPAYVNPTDRTLLGEPLNPTPHQRLPDPLEDTYRESAEEVLDQLLSIQETLQTIGVTHWAGTAYEEALATAARADAAYLDNDFSQAGELYRQSLEAMQEILAHSEVVYDEALTRGRQALTEEAIMPALTAFELALLINPASETASEGLADTLLLRDIIQELEAGTRHHERGQLERARERFLAALTLDSGHQAAGEALARVNEDILDRNLTNHLTAAYRALQAGNLQTALETFQQALVLRPDSAEAENGLRRTEEQLSLREFNRHMQAAQSFARAERWQEALHEYEQALAIDPANTAAQEGQERSNSRNNLDRYLSEILNAPLRLAETEVYQQTIAIYNEALPIDPPNTRLTAQLLEVRSYLEAVRQPRPVILHSDGLTRVSLQQGNELGSFTIHTLELTPGNYTLSGSHSDCQVEQHFTVPFHDSPPPTVTIQCREAP